MLFMIFPQIFGACLLALVTFSLAAVTQSPPTAVTSQTSPITIDPKLRKALLDALTNFDSEDSTEIEDSSATTSSSTTEDFEASTNNPSFVKIHSFAVDGDKSGENEVIKTIIISRPRTTLTPPKEPSNNVEERKDYVQIKFTKIPDPITEENEQVPNIQQARSVETRLTVNADRKEEKSKKKASEKSITKPITPATTTTLEPPTTNEDGENIEKVAKEDIRIQQAPLLAAFTVQQDVNGQPEKIISLFKNPTRNEINPKRIINMEFRASQPVESSQITKLSTQAPSTTIQATLNTQNSNQQLFAFEQKQRLLEDQIRFLQAKQRDQEEIIKRHQLHDEQQIRQKLFQDQQYRQQLAEQQNQRYLEEQRQRQRYEQEQQFLLRQQQAQALQQPQTQALEAPSAPSSVNVQFVPSIPLGHTVGVSVEQQLPFKGPVEFNPDKPELQKTLNQLQQQFQLRQFQKQQNFFHQNHGFGQQQPNAQPLIQQHDVQQLSSQLSLLPTNLELPVRQQQNFIPVFTALPTNLELPQKSFQTFNSAPLTVLPSITEIIPQTASRNRVFRNDAGQTGNFGTQSRNVEIQQSINPIDAVINQSLDNQLQNLLLQSGISTRSAEDFRIISKILALNHGVPDNLFLGNSRRF